MTILFRYGWQVLLFPAWKQYDTARSVKDGTVILHSRV
jgi:hypothetical protein